jgi:hypothetical protein
MASSDAVVLVLGLVLASLYLFRDQLFSSSIKPKTTTPPVKEANGHGNPRDFVAKMVAGVRYFLSLVLLHSLKPFAAEKAPCHLLRLTNRDGRGVRYPYC